MYVRIPSSIVFITALAIGATAAAQERGPQPQPEPQPRATQATAGISEQSGGFVAKATEAGAIELAAAQLAAQKASNPAVKAFASRMMTDHGKANEELSRLAADQSIKVGDPSGSVTAALSKLNNLSGAEFDKAYMEMQVEAHQDAVALFEHESTRGSDATIRAFAAKTLPVLREHQKMAHDTAQAVGVKGK